VTKPVVALVGRPNVGKSTLFNRLAQERLAVVDAVPGTTRDRLMANADWAGVTFSIIDTGGIDPTDTGPDGRLEPLSIGSADFIEQIRMQAEIAIHDADAVLFITDVESGVTPADQEVAEILRRAQTEQDGEPRPPVILVVNKADNEERRSDAYQFYELGIGDPYPISALHGTGTGDMLDALIHTFKDWGMEDEEDESVRVAIVGKPNVGKSSLLNKLLGQERAIVSPIPGTTRDAVDTPLVYEDIPMTLIDTAGIRRRGKIDPGVEKYSVLRSLRAIERASVGLLMVDATTGMTAQDTHIAGFILDAWKSAVLLVNKWDAIVKVLPIALQVHDERMMRLSTSQLNKILRKAQDRHPAPTRAGRPLKIYYGTQVRSDPPTFLLYVNEPDLAHFTYLRYLENRIREEYSFLGTPIRIVLRKRK
jgi:GTP-binding protein